MLLTKKDNLHGTRRALDNVDRIVGSNHEPDSVDLIAVFAFLVVEKGSKSFLGLYKEAY